MSHLERAHDARATADTDDGRRASSDPSPSTQSAWKRTIASCEVRFPLTPYKSQVQVMSAVVRAARRGTCALVESPTGSGKTLALLCAALAWSESESERREDVGVDDDEDGEEDEARKRETKRIGNGKPPKIYYATRTHAQIAQIVGELSRTAYKPHTVVLASREHYCVNKSARKGGDVNAECRRLMDAGAAGGNGKGCFYSGQGASKLASLAKNHPDALDIEDLVKMGTSKKGCPYFASKIMAESAELIFCPYNYLLDPRTRSAMDIDIEGSLIIFDEAHNIEDTAREAASEEIILDDVANAIDRLSEMRRRATANVSECELVLRSMKGVYDWFIGFCDEKSPSYGLKQTQEALSAMVRGEQILQTLAEAGLTEESVLEVMRALGVITKYNQENKDPKERVAGSVFNTCEKVLNPIKFLLSRGEVTARDYKIVFTKTRESDRVVSTQRVNSELNRLPVEELVKINFWALNPALAFRELVSENGGARSVVLTSGTLAPLNSFASELGVPFPIRMEAPHCVDMDRQVWGGIVAAGPSNIALNAGYKSRGDTSFQDELGACLRDVAKVTPHGLLMFFPSYSLLETIVRRWRETGLLRAIEQASGKKIFQEPGKSGSYGKKPVTLETVLEKYYSAVATSVKAAKHPYAPAPANAKCRGAILFAVCRGKISEGIDFADANARAVICVGIPYPNIKDALVAAKRSYNEEGAHRGLLSGSKWYDQQAFRALNQAVGRCLRHRHDHGAIMLVDSRFNNSNIQALPKWLRPAMQKSASRFGDQVKSLENFFVSHAENPPSDDAPASKTGDQRKNSKRARVSILATSPRKAMRNTPITSFFQKASTSNATHSDPLMRDIEQPSKKTKDDQIGDYEAPVFTDDDELDVDIDALMADNHELSPEANVAQVLDGVEWEDWEDDDDLMAHAVQATQTAHTMSKVESTTPTEQVLDVVSPLKQRAKKVCGDDSVCAKCGNTRYSQIDTENDDRIALQSQYLDCVLQTKANDIHEFAVVEMRGGCCASPPSETVEFDRDLRVAFSRVNSCDGDRLIGLRVEATNAMYAHLCDRVLLPQHDARA
jgi:Fanconi anemia group J protein